MKNLRDALIPIAAATALALIAVTLVLRPAHAGDEALYGPAAPPDSAFMRVFNATSAQVPQASIGSEQLSDISPFESSEWVYLPPGTHALKAGTVQKPVQMQRNRYYTAVLMNNDVQLFDNDRYSNRMKALVIVYNLLDGDPLSLKTADGGTAVVDNVAPHAFGTREVNPVKATLALYRGGTRVAGVRPMALERGKGFSLFVAGTPEQPIPVWVVN